MPRKANRTTPVIRGGMVCQHSAFGYDQYLIEAHPESFKRFLARNKSFYYDGVIGYTARKETRRGGEFWYAYKRVDGKLYNAYIGLTSEINISKLFEVGRTLRAKIRGY